MRKIFLLVILIPVLQSCGTYKTNTVHIGPISETFEINKAQEELFVSANIWMVRNFVNAKSVIQYSDKEAGVVAGKYLLKPLENSFDGVYATIIIRIKEGSSKITIIPQEFVEIDYAYVTTPQKYTEEMAVKDVQTLIWSYGDYIKNDRSESW